MTTVDNVLLLMCADV